MVRRRTLTPLIEVRALVPQPSKFKHLEQNVSKCFFVLRQFGQPLVNLFSFILFFPVFEYLPCFSINPEVYYGLSARCPTLIALFYHKASKDLLPGGWLSFRGGLHTRWITRPCPAARYVYSRSSTLTCAFQYRLAMANLYLQDYRFFQNP